jgi:AmmeMemoRadiSam system protein B
MTIPTRTDRIRRPAAAGLFYPAQPAELEREVERLLEEGAPAARASRPPKALVAPHAGYPYSGPAAGVAFGALRPFAAQIDKVILLGPSHHEPLEGLALPTATAFGTPLGIVPVDLDLARRVLEMEAVRVNDRTHSKEHALEVELPFLQQLLGDFEMLPLTVGEAAPEVVAEVLEAVWGGDETLIVISSDLSHYLSYDEAREIDRQTADAVLALDPSLTPRQACGARALNGLLEAGRRKGLVPELLRLENSGDTAGDRDRVVGYSAFAFHAPALDTP